MSTDIVRNRFLGFLLWQSLHSTAIFIICKAVFLSPFLTLYFGHSFLGFLTFHLSLLIFSASLSIICSPQPERPASAFQLALQLVRFIFISGATTASQQTFRRRARVSMYVFCFVTVSALSGFVSVVSLGAAAELRGLQLIGLGFRGFALGLVYGFHYVYKRRWALEFPIIQRPPFFSFKMCFPSAFMQALKLSGAAFILSAVMVIFLPCQLKNHLPVGKYIVEQIVFYIGSLAILLCWELSHNLNQVLNTKRFVFAPPKGSAAAETNPSEVLFSTLEKSTPGSLLQYLAYLDLCMVCESNVDTWRRAALFEESGETYKRVIAVCSRPLEQLASKLGEGLESCSDDKSKHLSHQLRSPTDLSLDLIGQEPFNDIQLCTWCARTVASLTARSHKEDRFGVAQLSGCNANVVSTLLSCLINVEIVMGKKTNLQSQNLMGPAAIKWATLNGGRRDVVVAGKKKSSHLYSKAYTMADVLRTSIYCIVSAFHDEMLNLAKAGLLEKDWVISKKLPCGNHEVLLQKLRSFLDFREC